MKKIAITITFFTTFVLLISAQNSVTTKKVYVRSTGQTFYSRYATVTQSSSGSNVVMSGMMRGSGSGEPQPIYVVCGDRGDVYTNPNGQTIITCNPSNNDCFEINNITNVELRPLVLVNQSTTTAYFGSQITTGFNPFPSLQVSISNVTEYGPMTQNRFNEIAYIQQTGGTTDVIGYVSQVRQVGNKWIVQCDPGPGWCLRYIQIPSETEIF